MATACSSQNYTLGRGQLYLARTGEASFRYIGNTPEFNLNITTDTVDHFCSDAGLKEKDAIFELQTTRAGSFITDHIDPENLALFFFGTTSAVTNVASVGNVENIASSLKGRDYKLGITVANPTGVFGIDPANVVVTAGGTTYVVGTDYVVDAKAGMIAIPTTSTIPDATALTVTYGILASTRTRVISGTKPVEGKLMYVSKNAGGTDNTFVMPLVRITPNGDIALKGDSFQQLGFNIEALKPSVGEAIYIDGAPL